MSWVAFHRRDQETEIANQRDWQNRVNQLCGDCFELYFDFCNGFRDFDDWNFGSLMIEKVLFLSWITYSKIRKLLKTFYLGHKIWPLLLESFSSFWQQIPAPKDWFSLQLLKLKNSSRWGRNSWLYYKVLSNFLISP